jgi:cytidine deaminase
MAALIEAARRGVSVLNCTMFVTTFPCHLCARHIVAAGIDRVLYIEPYAKSLAAELYPDSIAVETIEGNATQVVFEPFVGIAPRQYMHLFKARNRKTASGAVIRFNPVGAQPRASAEERVYLESEDAMLAKLTHAMRIQGILFE